MAGEENFLVWQPVLESAVSHYTLHCKLTPLELINRLETAEAVPRAILAKLSLVANIIRNSSVVPGRSSYFCENLDAEGKARRMHSAQKDFFARITSFFGLGESAKATSTIH